MKKQLRNNNLYGNNNCLNCGQPLTGYFCSNCGQPASARRFNMNNLLLSEKRSSHYRIVDFGFLYTIIELIRRPGHTTREYVEGKRINHFNFISLILLLVVVEQILLRFSPVQSIDMIEAGSRDEIESVLSFIHKYSRIITLCLVPLYAIVSLAWFRKAGYNFAEHIVLNAYRAAGNLLLFIVTYIILLFVHQVPAYRVILNITYGLSVFYAFWFMFQFFSTSGFRRFSLILRSAFAAICLYLLILLIALVIVLMAGMYG